MENENMTKIDLDDPEFIKILQDITPNDTLINAILSYFNIEGSLRKKCYEHLKNLPRIPIITDLKGYNNVRDETAKTATLSDESKSKIKSIITTLTEKVNTAQIKHQVQKSYDSLVERFGEDENLNDTIQQHIDDFKLGETSGTYSTTYKFIAIAISSSTDIQTIIHEHIHALYDYLNFIRVEKDSNDFTKLLNSLVAPYQLQPNTYEVLTQYFTYEIAEQLEKQNIHFNLPYFSYVCGYKAGVDVIHPILKKFNDGVKRAFASGTSTSKSIDEFFESIGIDVIDIEADASFARKFNTLVFQSIAKQILNEDVSNLTYKQMLDFLQEHDREFSQAISTFDEENKTAIRKYLNNTNTDLRTIISAHDRYEDFAKNYEASDEVDA